ncbi:MAG: hypothetical protein M3Y87_30420, partial [Myxococcota bacterium]|nr:hypothetical protein [Myxococcota bacterium]
MSSDGGADAARFLGAIVLSVAFHLGAALVLLLLPALDFLLAQRPVAVELVAIDVEPLPEPEPLPDPEPEPEVVPEPEPPPPEPRDVPPP